MPLYVGFKWPGVPAGGKEYKGKHHVPLNFGFLVGISIYTHRVMSIWFPWADLHIFGTGTRARGEVTRW